MYRAIFSFLFVLAVSSSGQQSAPEPQLRQRTADQAASTAIPLIEGVHCIEFDPSTLTQAEVAKGPPVNGHHWLYDVKSSRQNNKSVLKVIQHYSMDASCWVEDVRPFHFMLSRGSAPTGKKRFEDCLPHKFRSLEIGDYGKRYSFGQYNLRWNSRKDDFVSIHWFSNYNSAAAALEAYRRFGFTKECFVGPRPEVKFVYFKAD